MFDTHAHITLDNLNSEAIVRRANANNVDFIVNVCTDKSCLEKSIELEKKYNVYAAAGLFPQDIENIDFLELVEKEAKKNRLVAIGEIGLDYYYQNIEKKEQKKILEKQLELAKSVNLPVIFHCRDAFCDLFDITKKYQLKKAVIHCFTGSLDDSLQAIDRNWYISFSGIVTFKNSHLKKIVKEIPINRMVLETDSPYLAPQKYRGQQNEPMFLKETAIEISKLKNIDLDSVIKITTKNGKNLFSII